jgi:hypothetical protein
VKEDDDVEGCGGNEDSEIVDKERELCETVGV